MRNQTVAGGEIDPLAPFRVRHRWWHSPEFGICWGHMLLSSGLSIFSARLALGAYLAIRLHANEQLNG